MAQVRFKVPRGRVVAIDDAVRGHIEWDVQATVGDFILLRSSEDGGGGMPVYNFCVAVDDAQMEVTACDARQCTRTMHCKLGAA